MRPVSAINSQGARGSRLLNHQLLPQKKHQHRGQRLIPGVLELWLCIVYCNHLCYRILYTLLLFKIYEIYILNCTELQIIIVIASKMTFPFALCSTYVVSWIYSVCRGGCGGRCTWPLDTKQHGSYKLVLLFYTFHTSRSYVLFSIYQTTWFI